ncbi:unnamed protein product [Rotaria sp. Silwood1]|nr:unnamed protein product [Rotaria sp. Silwood1]
MPFDHETTVELWTDTYEQPLSVARVDHIPPTLTSQTLMRLAAKALLRELLHTSEPISREHVVDLSLKYGILCPYTAFIGIERRLDANSDSNSEMQLQEIPIVLSPICSNSLRQFYAPSYASCQNSQQLQMNVDPVVGIMKDNLDKVLERDAKLSLLENRACLLETRAAQFSCDARKLKRRNMVMEGFTSAVQSAVGYVSSLFTKSSADQINTSLTSNSQLRQALQVDWPTDEQELVSRFIELQKYDGLWILTNDDIKQLTGKSLTDFSSSIVDSIEKTYQSSVTTTALVVIILETRCVSNKTLWQTLSVKACTRMKELLGEDETKLQQLLKDIRDWLL